MKITEKRQAIDNVDAVLAFEQFYELGKPAFLLESKSINPLYGRMSLFAFDPLLEIWGKDETLILRVKNGRGQKFFDQFKDYLLNSRDISGVKKPPIDELISKSDTELKIKITKDTGFLPESERSKRKSIAQIIRYFLAFFASEEKTMMGLFGSFSYDFARLFENLPNLLEDKKQVADFHFFLFDNFVSFDLIKDKAEIIVYRDSEKEAEKEIGILIHKISRGLKKTDNSFQTADIKCDLGKEEFEKLVEKARELARDGETFEVVFSRLFSGKFTGNPLALYKIYREKNPAPYLFYFDFANSQLVGASPEMMVRVENGFCHLRPISGTRPRGKDPISDHENELELLSCKKERAELDMLIDLGRNDLKRVCETGIKITSYRHVEKYSRVMHTIAHLTGKLKPEYTALDALIACQSAGTLTGAPKVQAMIEIEKNETVRRGLYGGSIGYLTLSGEMDTGIIIRSAHIQNGEFEFRVGATLLYDSIPEDEYKETENKVKALLDILEKKNV